MRSPCRDPRTQPVPSMSAWADGSASTANTASGVASIVVDAVTRSGSIPVRRLVEPELIARASEPPPHRAGCVLGGTDGGRGARLELVDEPGRRAERGGVERRGDAGSRVVGLSRPSALRPQRRDLGYDLRVGDAPGNAGDHHVEAACCDADRAARVARNVLRL